MAPALRTPAEETWRGAAFRSSHGRKRLRWPGQGARSAPGAPPEKLATACRIRAPPAAASAETERAHLPVRTRNSNGQHLAKADRVPWLPESTGLYSRGFPFVLSFALSGWTCALFSAATKMIPPMLLPMNTGTPYRLRYDPNDIASVVTR